VVVDFAIGAGAVSVSATGLVAYRPGGGGRRQLAWFDRSGNSLGNMGPPDEYNLSSPTVSRDGRRVAVFRTENGNTDIFLRDAVRTRRFTVDPAWDAQPFWSHDDSRVLFDSNRKGHRDLYLKASSGGGTEDLLYESAQDKTATDWSVDGRFVMYQSSDPQTNWDLWVLPMGGDRRPTPWVFLRTGSSERMGQISPDGRFVAYMSNESGSPEIRIRLFAEPTAPGAAPTSASAQWTASTTGGGIFPRWGRDSTVLYYLGPTGAMMAAPITATGTTLTPGAPVALFNTRIYGGGVDNGQGRQYDVTRDGRFLINTVLDAASAPITLLQNWSPAAKK
jgi:Tol biopolymer transport system component